MKMNGKWEMLIVDAVPPTETLDSLAAGDVDGDGKPEIITGGNGAIFWYKSDTYERGIISEGLFHVGLALEDIDGDGILEVISSKYDAETKIYSIVWFKPGADIKAPWTMFTIDPLCAGNPHDLLFADIDGDGEMELIADAAYTTTPGIYAYKMGSNPKEPWNKYQIMNGVFTEALAVGDLNGDGKLEIVSGPDMYTCPSEGPFSGVWERKVIHPGLREMCRAALVDITGNGRPDIILTESEYEDGKLIWFENRMVENPENPWVEHLIDENLIFAHSLQAWKDDNTGEIHIFTAEMEKGGFGAAFNYDARLIEYISSDNGTTWKREIMYKGSGTHQAILYDIDGDGELEVLGKVWGKTFNIPRVQIWKYRENPSVLSNFKHRFIDRDKPFTGIDLLAVDVDGDGLEDIVCGAWWYKNPGWKRYDIPGVFQVINYFDIDKDGKPELIALKKSKNAGASFYSGLGSEMCWLKPIDPEKGIWEEHPIGEGSGDWPHSSLVAPLLPECKLAMAVGYHSAQHTGSFPEIFEIPDNPADYPWPKKIMAEVPYGEEMLACDIDGDGTLDIAAGNWWFENLGDGNFKSHKVSDSFEPARVCVADINGDGRLDMIAGEEVLDFQNKVVPFSRLVWFENPEDPVNGQWKMHVIDKLRCGHSLSVADLDGDGEMEIICAEHDPFKQYHTRARLMVYKKGNSEGTVWYRYVLDSHFEHHDGAKIIELSPGKYGIISHAWKESRYLHLWELEQ
jgi:hypothetical protein